MTISFDKNKILNLPPFFSCPHYFVYRKYGDDFDNFMYVEWDPGIDSPEMMVVGHFSVPVNVPIGFMRNTILENAEKLIMSSTLIQSEEPVFIAWNGENFTDSEYTFGMRI
jgi:hypothetical protein